MSREVVFLVRDVSEREFVNYVRGAGGYTGYSDANQAVEAVISVVKSSFKEDNKKKVENIFPPGILALWERIPAAEQDEIGLVSSVEKMQIPGKGKQAVLSVFAAFREKLQEKANDWEQILNDEYRQLWEESKSAAPCQNAGEFL